MLNPKTTVGMVCVLWALTVCLPALADKARGDGDYGRFRGDMALSAALGGGIVTHAPAGGLFLSEFRARYLDMAGLLIAPEYRTQNSSFNEPSHFRLSIAVDVRPLFLARFLRGDETGNAFADLLIDSIGVDVGTTIRFYDSGAINGPDAGFLFGTGFDIPLVIEQAHGTFGFLRFEARYTQFFSAQRLDPQSDWTLVISLGAKHMIRTGLSSWERPVTP
jgi:hypothetical protein